MRSKIPPPGKDQADSFSTFLEIAQSIPYKRAQKGFRGIDEETLPPETGARLTEEMAEEMEEAPPFADEEELGPKVLRAVAQNQPITVVDLMRRCQLDFLQFARQMNNLSENGLLEITPSQDDPDTEIVRLSRRGRQLANALFPSGGEMP